MLKVKDIVKLMNELAPVSLAFSWDNCGLLAGSEKWAVKKILFALDITLEVVDEAIALNAELIISHHPLIFKPLTAITDATMEGEILIKILEHKIAIYAAHTSLDAAENGVNDVLCKLLDLKNVIGLDKYTSSDGLSVVSCGRVGELSSEMTFQAFCDFAQEKINTPNIRCCGDNNRSVKKIAICGGAGDSLSEDAISAAADVFLSGELKYHTALKLKEKNICFVEAGHYYTECPVLKELITNLQNKLNMLQYNVMLIESLIKTDPYNY